MRGTEHSPSKGRIRLSVLVATVAVFLLVPASQALANGTMHLSIVGTGAGEVSSSESALFEETFGYGEGTPPIECTYTSPGPASGVCENEMEHPFEENAEVTGLSAVPAPGSVFTGWVVEEGQELVGCGEFIVCGAGHEPSTGTDASVIAIFECETEGGCEEGAPEFSLTVTPEGTGEGTVTSTPAGINCGSECEAEFEEGEEVELSQSAETGSEFVEWGGACSGTGSCEVTMDEAKEVTATFDLEPTPEFELEVNTAGTGEGEVSCEVESGPAEPCEAKYLEGTEVALVPEAETGSEFVEWGEDCTGTGACELTIDEAKSVTATFDLEPTPEFKLTIAKAGTGSGSVTCDGGACAAEYPEGEEVTLAATAASGATFSGWSGAGCSGTAPCTVTIEEDTTVTATFTANAKPEETCATNASLCPPPPPSAETKCIVPKLAKKTLGQAKSALRAAHCTLGKVTKPKKKGALVVKSSKPGAGTTLVAGAKVALKLGPKPKKK